MGAAAGLFTWENRLGGDETCIESRASERQPPQGHENGCQKYRPGAAQENETWDCDWTLQI